MIVVDFPQQSPEWFAARLGIPTASEFHRIITPVKWQKTANSTWLSFAAELIDQIKRPDHQSEFQGNEHTERGNIYEDEARRMYEYTNGVEVKQVGMILHDSRRYAASPDGLVGDDGGIEVKCHDGKAHAQILLGDQGVPPLYLPQIHGNLSVTGCEWWDFISYCNGYAPYVKRVYRSEKTDQLTALVERFCEYLEECKLKLTEDEVAA